MTFHQTFISLVPALLFSVSPPTTGAQELPIPQPTTRADFHEFGEKLIGDWTSSGTIVVDWKGDSKNKKGQKYKGSSSFRWTANKQALMEDLVIGDATIARVYTWEPETRMMSARGMTSAGSYWHTKFWKRDGVWQWVHRETATATSPEIKGFGDCPFTATGHVRRGTLFEGTTKLPPYRDVYFRTSVRLEDFRPMLGRFQAKAKLFTDFAGSPKGADVTFIQDRHFSHNGQVLEVHNYVSADGITSKGSVELHRFDPKLGTTRVVAASAEGLLEGTWRMKPDGKTLSLDWTWGEATGQSEMEIIDNDTHTAVFKNVVSGAAMVGDSEVLRMRRVGSSPEQIAALRKTLDDYFLGDWEVSRATDGVQETGTMKVERAANGHGHLVTQRWATGDMTALFGFDSAEGRWTGQWQISDGGVIGREVWPELEPGPLKSGDTFLSRQESIIDGQRGMESWAYEINSQDHFFARCSNNTLSGRPQPNTVMEFKRRKAIPETVAAKAWRQFLVGDWLRETELTVDGKTTKSEYEWTCRNSGDTNVSFATTGDGYAVVMAWMPERAGLVETGHGDFSNWEIVFKPTDDKTAPATSIGRMKDGRHGIGTNLVTRTSADTFTAEATVKLDDGSTMHVIDRNKRK